jgi:transposase InsO family protein
VNRYVNHCDTCKRIKPVKHATFGLLRLLQLPEWPWDSISMDFIIGLPLVEGCNTLWVIVDRFTKMAHFYTCADTMGLSDLVDGFLTHVVWAHGLPNSLVSDRGSLFTSTFWTRIMEAMGTTRNLSTSFHPKTDGQTKCTNAILEQYLWAYCNYQQDNWKQLLPIAEFCYNNTQSETTKVTPFFTNCRYHPHFTPNLGGMGARFPKVSRYISTLNNLHTALWAEINYAQMSQAEQANKARHPDPILRPGDLVWLWRKYVKMTHPSSK